MNGADHTYVPSPDWVRRTHYSIDSSNHHYIVLSFLHKWMLERGASAANGHLLDYGCGGQPYRAIFEPIVKSYVAADIAAYGDKKLDVLLVPNKRVPLPDCSFDTVLASQTLEHVPDPPFYIGECARLLRPGGVLILTAPMQWRHHEIPYDYFRFTRFGIESLLENGGFEIVEKSSTGGVFALIGQILLNHIAEKGVHKPQLNRLINQIALWLDRRYPDGDDVINWMFLARRREPEGLR
jgi:SAM-dependent methyltransferase